MAKSTVTEPLTGEALLEKVRELGDDYSKEEKAKACGYITATKKGQARVNMMKFYNALMEAQGIDLDSSDEVQVRGGRAASYRIGVQSNGNLLIGAAYTKKMNLQPGDEFEITLGRKHIHLKQVDAEGDDDEE